MTQYALLPDRAVFAVEGTDARDFLQGLITGDAREIGNKPQFSALLSPQGRFCSIFFIVEQNGKILFDTDKARLPDLLKRLNMYKLRSKVSFAEQPHKVAAFWEGTAPAGAFADPRLGALGSRML